MVTGIDEAGFAEAAVPSRPRRKRTYKRRLTLRDQAFLEWLVQQYGAPIDLVAAWYGVRRSWAYEIVRALQKAGKVDTTYATIGLPKHLAGPMWVVPTRSTAHAVLGTDPGPWMIRPSTAAHVSALGELRLKLAGPSTDPQVWLSERLLARAVSPRGEGTEISHSRPYTHDGVYRDSQGKNWAIEAELSIKSGAGRMESVLRTSLEAAKNTLPNALDLGERGYVSGVIYFCRSTSVYQHVEKAKARLGKAEADSIHLRDLDKFLGKTTTKQVPQS